MESISNICTLHGLTYLKCTFENCDKQQVCKVCAFNKKEDLEHISNHFDHLKSKSEEELNELISKQKDYEGYAELNKIYIESLKKADSFCEDFFRGLNNVKVEITNQLRMGITNNYLQTTENFESLVKNLTEKLSNLNLQDKKAALEIKKIRGELDIKTTELNNLELLQKQFVDNFDKASKKINQMKIDDLLKLKFNFTGKRGKNNTELININSNSFNLSRVSPSNTGSYWTIKSQEVLEGAFEAKIRVIHINSSSANSYWNYGVGIMKFDSTKDSSYYDDGVVYLSNGWLANKFSGSGSHNQLFNSSWKNGDAILIKRDENNNVYFGMNEEYSYKLAFGDISGKYRIIFGFSSSIKEGEFELEELYY
jgi:flagellar biosynthesis chaperone FliJ